MNKKSFCKHLGLAALASLISSATLAQDTPPPLPGGLSLNGGTINLSAITGNVIHSKQTAMLRRPDVQTNIHLSVKQREELGDYLDANKPQMIRVEVTNGSAPVVSGLSGELDEKVKSILKKEQLDRLAELDLQWRGYLAVSDPKVQELLNISNDSKDKIKELMGVYCSERDAIMQRGMREQTENPDSNSVVRRVTMDTSLFENPLSKERKQMQALKDKTEEGISKILTAEQRTQLQKLQGEAFKFRNDVKGEWRRVFMN